MNIIKNPQKTALVSENIRRLSQCLEDDHDVLDVLTSVTNECLDDMSLKLFAANKVCTVFLKLTLETLERSLTSLVSDKPAK